jgi:hypothetical protein
MPLLWKGVGFFVKEALQKSHLYGKGIEKHA